MGRENNVVVDDCCQSYCDGCPWAAEQKIIDKENETKASQED